MTTIHKVAIYVRVSTTNQAEEGYSIEEQKDKLEAYCKIKDWGIHKVYTDGGFSGSNTDRPALEQLINDAKKKLFDTVLVYKLDRLSRSQKDTLYLIEDVFLENKIDFISLLENFDTSTPFGKAMVGILSVFAQLEREQIKERMQLGKLGRAKSGKSMMWSRTAYGYTYQKETEEMVINTAEAIIVKTMFDKYLAGMSITKIRDHLNENNMNTKSVPWSYRAIRVILSNPVYAGYNQFRGEIYKGNHQPIISKKDFDKTQKEIQKRQIEAYKFNNNPRPFQAKYMLSGLIKCGYCGTPLTITLGTKRKDGSRSSRYQCKNRLSKKTKGVTTYNDNKKCNSGFYEKAAIEEHVLNEMVKLQTDAAYLNSLFDERVESVDRGSIHKQLTSIDNKMKRISDLYIDDLINLDELKKKTAELKSTKKLLEAELKNDPALKQQESKVNMQQVLNTDNILAMSYDQQKVIIRALINKVQVTAEEIVIKWKI